MPDTSPRSPLVQDGIRRLLSKDEAAAQLGVTRRHVDRAIAEKRLRRTKLGRLIRIDPADLDAYIAAGREDT